MGITLYEPNELRIGDISTDDRLVAASGEGIIEEGTLLKLDGGKLKKCLTTETPHSIANEEVDATDIDADISYIISGKVNENHVNYNNGTADEFREALRVVGILTYEGV